MPTSSTGIARLCYELYTAFVYCSLTRPDIESALMLDVVIPCPCKAPHLDTFPLNLVLHKLLSDYDNFIHIDNIILNDDISKAGPQLWYNIG